jgi:hypothetical protein
MPTRWRIAQADHRQAVVHPGACLRPGQALHRSDEAEELARAQRRVDAEVLRQVAQGGAQGVRIAGDVDAVPGDPAGAGPGHGRQHPHQRRLAGTVRAEQAQDPGAEVQRQAADRGLVFRISISH